MNWQLRKIMTLLSRLPVLLLILTLALGGELARADVTATISGLVRDPSGAVVPGAQVTARNQQTGTVMTVVTDARGFTLCGACLLTPTRWK